ncbi:Transcriptional regulator, AraC family protein [Sandaracinus amylolyticus]|uniref:Transcriptional regulator, AraC family protein n=1 Tax=Sandaracinus amylolyticus TaxID=927083 RepID=A0A0F6VZ04_9BACT|nr:Transcriptional regulator, AraC family protein [Sandaracinus amylolyticus]
MRFEHARDRRGVEHAIVRMEGESVWLHMPSVTTLAWVSEGRVQVHRRGTRRELGRGAVRRIGGFELEVIRADREGARLSLVSIPRSFLRGARTVPHDQLEDATHGALARVAARWPSGPPALDREIDELVDLVRHVDHDDDHDELEPGPVRRARHLLETWHRAPPTLDELAGVARTTKLQLVRSFHAHHGVVPHTFVLCLRLAIARTMFASGRRETEAAHALGFPDASALTREFRRIVGVSPAEYARPRPIAVARGA